MMYERRWPVIVAGVLGLLVVATLGWVAGRSSAPDGSAGADGAHSSAVEIVNGVPVGVEHSRAGALAAADNYVAVGSETVLQDPARYARLVRETYAPSYQPVALREARAARAETTNLAAQYAAGRKGLALVAARRLDSYAGDQARVTTWTAGISWGPGRAAGQRWFLTETALRWTGDRWRVERIDESRRAAPTPGVVRYSDKAALNRDVFDRELDGMTAPSYGAQTP